jgi:hypothetical protein
MLIRAASVRTILLRAVQAVQAVQMIRDRFDCRCGSTASFGEIPLPLLDLNLIRERGKL